MEESKADSLDEEASTMRDISRSDSKKPMDEADTRTAFLSSTVAVGDSIIYIGNKSSDGPEVDRRSCNPTWICN